MKQKTEPPFWDKSAEEYLDVLREGTAVKLKDPQKWSQDFVDFVSKCLEFNPENRFSASALIRHPFISKRDEDCFF